MSDDVVDLSHDLLQLFDESGLRNPFSAYVIAMKAHRAMLYHQLRPSEQSDDKSSDEKPMNPTATREIK